MSAGLFAAALLALSALPIVPAYAWIAARRPRLVPGRFLAAAAAGLPAVALALLAKLALPEPSTTFAGIAFAAFVGAALTEEAAKLASVVVLRRFLRGDADDGAALGIASSLGFAFFETAVYAASDPVVAIVRAATAAPLHAACGARIGAGAYAGSWPRLAGGLAAAVAVHGAYDLGLFLPGFPPFVSPAIAALAMLSAVALVPRDAAADPRPRGKRKAR